MFGKTVPQHDLCAELLQRFVHFAESWIFISFFGVQLKRGSLRCLQHFDWTGMQLDAAAHQLAVEQSAVSVQVNKPLIRYFNLNLKFGFMDYLNQNSQKLLLFALSSQSIGF